MKKEEKIKVGDIIITEDENGEESDAVVKSVTSDCINVWVSPFVRKINNGNKVFKWDNKTKKFERIIKSLTTK